VTKLVSADSVTHSGTSAFAANVQAFDVTPLGQAARITRPIAIAGGTSNNSASP
jgi:hypothetical protein